MMSVLPGEDREVVQGVQLEQLLFQSRDTQLSREEEYIMYRNKLARVFSQAIKRSELARKIYPPISFVLGWLSKGNL